MTGAAAIPTQNHEPVPVRESLSPRAWALARQLAEYRTFLQEKGNDVSLRATARRHQRPANNLMGQAAELAFSAWLTRQDISFSARCFTITYRRENSAVQPPFVDFLLPGNLKCDLKADRYDIRRLGCLLPVEKFLEKIRTDLVVWAESQETDQEPSVILHGWNWWADLEGLREDPDATGPDGTVLPKRAKRVSPRLWRDMRKLSEVLQERELGRQASQERRYIRDC
ncbi:hypothetical protein [Thiomonas sp.]